MAAGIAKISGHDVSSDKVKAFVIACLAGDACEEIVKGAGIKIGQGLAKSALQKVPGKTLIEVNKKVGFRLITKAGEKGAVNLMKMVPLAGGIVGGGFDAGSCRVVGKVAKHLFYQKGPA